MLPRRLLYAGRLQTDGQQWMYIGTSWMCHGSVTLTRMLYAVRIVILHCVSKNAPTLASCSVDKRRLILIIFGKQHQRTFKNYMRVQLSSSLHFYLLYLQPFHIWPLACQKWANTAWWKLRRLKTCKMEWTVRVMQENKSGCFFFFWKQWFTPRCAVCIRRCVPLHNPTSLSEHQDRVPVSRTSAATARRPLRTLLLYSNSWYSYHWTTCCLTNLVIHIVI